jgi:hypothetical protein
VPPLCNPCGFKKGVPKPPILTGPVFGIVLFIAFVFVYPPLPKKGLSDEPPEEHPFIL